MNCVEGVRSRLRKPVVHLHHREIWNMIQEVEFLHPWGWFCPNFWTNGLYKRKGTKQTNLEALNSTKSQKASLPVEVRRAMLVSQTMKRRPCWCPKPVLWELNSFLMQMLSLVPKNLHRCWPREWKHSIRYFTVVCSVPWPLHRSKAGGDLVLLQTLLFFICKWSCSLVC